MCHARTHVLGLQSQLSLTPLLAGAEAALALVLHYHRFRYAAKKTDHSITYKTSHYTNGAPLAVEPTLTIKLEQDRSSHC